MATMSQSLTQLIRRIVGAQGEAGLAELDVAGQFDPQAAGDAMARSLNAAFLLALGNLDERAETWLAEKCSDSNHGAVARFYHDAVRLIRAEIEQRSDEDSHFRNDLQRAASDGSIWAATFPEGLWCLENPAERAAELRQRRGVSISQLNPEPLIAPGRQILFTSNVLLTVPPDSQDINALPLSNDLKNAVRKAAEEPQLYWYDHPIPIGIDAEQNEVIYGLRGLNESIAFEKQRGNADPDDRITVLLSVSVTHRGLQHLAVDYLRQTLAEVEPFEHLRVYVITEEAADQLVDRVLAPAAERLGLNDVGELLHRVIGVDGAYGRHYSFLKAIAALWAVTIDPKIKATFKIDLDQVFPQKELVEQAGGSAFELFSTPLWGAQGIDRDGEPIELGMIAGALVNESDIGRGLFTPDVTPPRTIPPGEASVFYTRITMALSTEAEMMCRYDASDLDGRTSALQRIHVTGGTNGILIASLRRHRPFTPTFIGRAEDQAYLLSVLYRGEGPKLRYAHRPGLIMRHDKHAFAGDAIHAAREGRFVGDLLRTLYFSYYAHVLPWGADRTKRTIDPFTGGFVSRIPITLVMLRLSLACAERFATDDTDQHREAACMSKLAADRLGEVFERTEQQGNPIATPWAEERRAWDAYYDILDGWERCIAQDEDWAQSLAQATGQLMHPCRIDSD